MQKCWQDVLLSDRAKARSRALHAASVVHSTSSLILIFALSVGAKGLVCSSSSFFNWIMCEPWGVVKCSLELSLNLIGLFVRSWSPYEFSLVVLSWTSILSFHFWCILVGSIWIFSPLSDSVSCFIAKRLTSLCTPDIEWRLSLTKWCLVDVEFFCWDGAGNKQNLSHVVHDVQQLGKRNPTPLKTTNNQNVLSPLQQNKNGSLRQRLDLVEPSAHAKHRQTEFHAPDLVENLRCLNLGQGGLKRNFSQSKDVQHYGRLF